MARKTEKFEVAAREVEERFGHRGIKLVEFSGRSNPCVIYCPEHGNQTYGRFGSMFRGNSMGCPACGKARAAKIANASHQSVREELENLKQAITGMTKNERITTQAYNEMMENAAVYNTTVGDVYGNKQKITDNPEVIMARKTFEEAASEVAGKFSERGITLVEYEGTAKPCVINCPRHGNFRVSRYQQLFQSQSGGCKECAKELTSAALESSRQAAQDVWNAYRMTKSVAGSNNIILNDVQGDTTINNHHTHTHNHTDSDGKALSMRLTPRPLLSDRQAAAFARTGKLTGSFDLFASVVAPSQYTFAVAMPDTSMSPVIEKGDLVVVEPRMRPADEDIVLVELSDKQLVVAHLVIDIAGRMLIYQTGRPSEAFDLPDGSTILGVVLEVKKRFMSASQARRRVDSDYAP